MPLAVVSKGQPFGIPESALGISRDALKQAWSAAQDAMTPDAHLVIAIESGHYVQLQQPDLVIGEIERVLKDLHDPESWTGTNS